MIKTVIFDLGGVYFTDGTQRAIDIISERFSLNKNLVTEVFKGEIGSKYRRSEISHEQFWELAKQTLKISAKTDELADIWLSGYVPIKGTVQIIKTLKSNGYELLFLSDNVQERVDYLSEKYNFLVNFKDGVFSHLIGVRKPNIKIYEYALEKTKSKPEECVYIDDKADLLLPAEQLGMKTIHFRSAVYLKEKLMELGLNLNTKN